MVKLVAERAVPNSKTARSLLVIREVQELWDTEDYAGATVAAKGQG